MFNLFPQKRIQDFLIVFFISLFCIVLELIFTRILNLKTFNHIVYVIIPFAILGYGIGANMYLLLAQRLRNVSQEKIISTCLVLLSLLSILSVLIIIYFPLKMKMLEDLLVHKSAGLTLSLGYLIVMLPFVVIGFLILFFFSKYPESNSQLYFWDLVGAGTGAWLFFFLIKNFYILHTTILLSSIALSWAISLALKKNKQVAWIVGILIVILTKLFVPEINNYLTDSKGWENFPNYFKRYQYDVLFSKWHPLGRTDAYRLNEGGRQRLLYYMAEGTFEINLRPLPDFYYLSTNFLGGTPVYHLSEEGLKERNSKLELFSEAMEFPYVLLHEPNVCVIGTGGGRDIFYAKTHGALRVDGAEINPQIYTEMTEGGELFDYSGKIYRQENVHTNNVDGRHLVKNLPQDFYDLIVLNGVDTFSGLSSGAYAYAESYLYTKNAVIDYMRILKPAGMINFNRWMDEGKPRETLRLMSIVMAGLREIGIQDPWEHIMIGSHRGWGMLLVKKSPFTAQETTLVRDYFAGHRTDLVYPSSALFEHRFNDLNYFDLLALAFKDKKDKDFIENYPFDISPVTDDNPFFYKYYRFRDFNPVKFGKANFVLSNYGAGLAIFMTQALVLVNSIFFSLLFIFGPLFLFKRRGIIHFSIPARMSFIFYFACLGVGFMFFEIPLMQMFVLLLGSPIYSISVVLAGLLIFSGFGSLLLPAFEKKFREPKNLIIFTSACLSVLTIGLILGKDLIVQLSVGWPFGLRVLTVLLILLPFGLCLGTFFPSGLKLIKPDNSGAIAWAWGINCGFSVMGSMLAIIVAQFHGFSVIMISSLFLYVAAAFTFQTLRKQMAGQSNIYAK